MKTAKNTLNKMLVEIWDKESGIELYDLDYDNIDMTITMYTDNTYTSYRSMSIDIDTAQKLVPLDLDSLFGYTEWMMGLYFFTQLDLTDEVAEWAKKSFLELYPDYTERELEQAIAHEKNEIRKMEFAS